MDLDLDLRKQELRFRYGKLRKEFFETDFIQSGTGTKQLGQNISRVLSDLHHSPKICASYMGYGSEADPSYVNKLLPDWTWVYPKMVGDELEFYNPSGKGGIVQHDCGIYEPDPATSQAVSLDQCSVVLVPGRAFDRKGNRLGSGRGFYDRALATFKGLKVGVGFSVQVATELLVCEAHDVHLDLLVTEKFICNPNP